MSAIAEFRNSAELSKHYARVRDTIFRGEAALRERADRDMELIRQLHRIVGRQMEEMTLLTSQITSFQREIDALQGRLQESKVQLEKLNRAPIDRIGFDVARVLKVVAAAHGVTVNDIKGPRRDRQTSAARQNAIYVLCANRPDLSLSCLGRLIGGRDHSSIMYNRNIWPVRKESFSQQAATVDAELGLAEMQE